MNRTLKSTLQVTLVALLALSIAGAAQADDRRLISGFEEIPTVFFLFDTSGSMHWSSQCTQVDFDAGDCDYLCPSGDCWVPGNGDSPNSKLYQAKEAIYQVLDQTENFNVGFATFNQDDLRARRKHWVYEALNDGPNIDGWGPYPLGRSGPTPGDLRVFGDRQFCQSGTGPNPDDDDTGCDGAHPADLSDQWERERVLAWPTETPDFNGNADRTTTTYVRHDGDTYEMKFLVRESDPHTLGDATIRVRVSRALCLNGTCSSTDTPVENAVDYGLVTDYLVWDFNTNRGPARAGFFAQGTVSDGLAHNGSSCVSWDANTDSAADIHDGTNLRWPTVADADFTPLMDVGDVLPIDWRASNKTALFERLAPNLALSETVPDFRVATYFEDVIVPTDELKLKDQDARPILAYGATPIGTSLAAFHLWANGPAGNGGWVDVAELNDPSFICRKTYLIVLSDGNQSTCDTDDPCNVAGTKELFDNLDIKTFVVAFGVAPHTPILPLCTGDPEEAPNVTCCASAGEPLCNLSGDPTIPPDAWPPGATNRQNRSLRCMASTGGTGNEDYDGVGGIDSETGPGVIYPQNQGELIGALVSILDEIVPAPAAFSTAAVPSVQAEAADKVFLSEFTPIAERATWQGKVNAFLKPLPIDAEGKPDTTELCTGAPDESACLLWEAGDVILNDQALPAVGNPVGDLEFQRRIYYSELGDGVPKTRHFLLPTQDGVTPLAQEFDFWRGFDVDFTPGDGSTYVDARTDANNIVDFVTSIKTTPMNLNFPIPFSYVLPDIFHSDPLLLGSPDNLLFFFGDVNGYRDFAIDHAFRRRILLFGTNGGMLHGIDAGVCRDPVGDDPRVCVFDNGSGRELFAYAPRIAMPILNELALAAVPRHRFAVDGRTQAADVFIDPLHDGALSVTDPPDPIDREWRTILIGGLREGGNLVPEDIGDTRSPALTVPGAPLPINQPMSGYYALDVTQPDPLTPPPAATPNQPPVPDATLLEPPACLVSSDGITPDDPDCGTIAFAAPLWEFTDSIEGVRLDEDDNGYVDLAFAWSNPSIGRIQVCESPCADPELDFSDRHVAIFGGGFDSKSPFSRGNHLYILDIETGEAIYKRHVPGAIGSEAAAVDTDFNGYLDTIYVGTSAGDLFRVDIGPIDHDNNSGTPLKYPEVVTTTVMETDLSGTDVMRDVERIIDSDFDPHLILETTDMLAEPLTVRPIFMRPSVIYLPSFNKYAVAVGTGNRDDIFRRDQPTGRFFIFVDNATHYAIKQVGFVPFSPTHPGMTQLDPDSPTRLEEVDLLQEGEGWWLELATNERLVTEPFALSGILFFSTFIPDPDGPEIIPEGSLCREKGVSNVYGVFTSNADGLLADDENINDPNDLIRYLTVSGLVSAPFTEQAQTKNPPPAQDVDTIDDLTGRLKYVRDRLKLQFPDNCTFPPGYRTDVKTRGSGTEISFIAPVPICVVEKSFREF